MNVYDCYLRDLAYILRDEAQKAKAEAVAAAPGDSFEKGKAFAYYEVVSLMAQQAEAFQIPLEKLSWADFDPESLI